MDSMTGYGASERLTRYLLSLEIKSYNNRYLNFIPISLQCWGV